MALSPSELGAYLDRQLEGGRVSVWETATAVTVSNVDLVGAQTLSNMAVAGEWALSITDDAGQLIAQADLEADFEPFVLTIQKPAAQANGHFLTLAGFRESLLKGDLKGNVQVAACEIAFANGLVAVNPWGAGAIFSASPETKSPRKLVRDSSGVGAVPDDIRLWLLRNEASAELWEDPAFQVYAQTATPFLFRSIASEATRDAIVFNGPPKASFGVEIGTKIVELGIDGFRRLQSATAWVYEDPKAAEQRHALLAVEVARSAQRDQIISSLFNRSGHDLLESARLAYQLGQSDLSRESIKAQGDLRKAIADDMTKAADSTRTMVANTAVAVGTSVGLVAARAVTQTPGWILSVIGGIVALHLAAVAVAGWMALRTQDNLRQQWRRRFYRFISDEDYRAMIEQPAEQAEHQYHLVASVAVITAAVMFVLALLNFDLGAGFLQG